MDKPNGLGGLGWVGLPLVVNPRLAAPRGEQHTNAFQADEQYGRIDWGLDGDDDRAGGPAAGPAGSRSTMDTALPEDNIGYRMLLKMGWSKGRGLGANEDGIMEPVRAGVEDGVRLGLGKQEQDNFFTDAEHVGRRRLETEIQGGEDEERRQRREAEAERDAKIKQEVSDIKQTFLCTMCDKQYSNAMELDAHLSSYDHHHKKRLVEMRSMHAERTRGERERREAKQQEKETRRLHQQIERAGGGAAPRPPTPPPAADAALDADEPAPPLPPPDEPSASAPPPPPLTEDQEPPASLAPPPSSEGFGLSLSFGMAKPGGRGGLAAGGGRGGLVGEGG
ncbi:hypothetical protein FOA52_001657 [Chlamydomonas sp. UWO 241]|nr:hypothetical protein FOA52_001657 [Chlamydomonas sp. UWO 241]